MNPQIDVQEQVILKSAHLQDLLVAIRNENYDLVGPTVRDGAIVYDSIDSVSQLPKGWTDLQEAATYRLKKRNDAAYFGYVVGPHSWKKFLFPPKQRLFQSKKTSAGYKISTKNQTGKPYAFLGVRGCELKAIQIQDKVFLEGPYKDSHYDGNRKKNLIIAVNCVQAGGTCFCVSMNTGPRVKAGYDLALTEIIDEEMHLFYVEVGSSEGAKILSQVPYEKASEQVELIAEQKIEEAADQMGRSMDTTNIKDVLMSQLDHPLWKKVGERCLSCANCTMVCPTCFCSTVEDTTDLTGDHAERWRTWDSCFTIDFSYMAGGTVRSSTKARYRQWMTHKLATWFDQFGTSGCVGCGRCITWCPVGIDITEELKAIRKANNAKDRR